MSNERVKPVRPIPILEASVPDSDVGTVSRPPAGTHDNLRVEDVSPAELFLPAQLLVLGTAIQRLNRRSPDKAKRMGVALTEEESLSMLAAGRKLLAETPGLEAKMATAQGALFQRMGYFRRHKSEFAGPYINPNLSLNEQIMKIMSEMNDMQLIQLRIEASARDLPLRRGPAR